MYHQLIFSQFFFFNMNILFTIWVFGHRWAHNVPIGCAKNKCENLRPSPPVLNAEVTPIEPSFPPLIHSVFIPCVTL